VGATLGSGAGLGATVLLERRCCVCGDGTMTGPPVPVVTVKLGTSSAGCWTAALFGVTAFEPSTMMEAVAPVVTPTSASAATTVLVDVANAACSLNAAASFIDEHLLIRPFASATTPYGV
jgi:hypothetical protein